MLICITLGAFYNPVVMLLLKSAPNALSSYRRRQELWLGQVDQYMMEDDEGTYGGLADQRGSMWSGCHGAQDFSDTWTVLKI